jgi:hypothetical protein
MPLDEVVRMVESGDEGRNDLTGGERCTSARTAARFSVFSMEGSMLLNSVTFMLNHK